MAHSVPIAAVLCAVALAAGLVGGVDEAEGVAETTRPQREEPHREAPGVGLRGDRMANPFDSVDPHGTRASLTRRLGTGPASITDGLVIRRWPEVRCEADLPRALSVCRRIPGYGIIP